MKWAALAAALAIGATLGVNSFILALASDAGNPHQSFLSDTDSCKTCHQQGGNRMKSALGVDSIQALCLSCHGHQATGAATDVEWGVLRARDEGLRGGGFTKAFMDTGLTGTPELSGVTSTHNISGAALVAWGYGDIQASRDLGMPMRMRCTSCHDPHGNGNYRALRPQPGGAPDGARAGVNAVYLADETDGGYTVKYTADFRRDVSYVPANMSEWCAQCHTRYLAPLGAGSADSGDAVFRFRHTTSVPGGCLACHVAHGTAATMERWSGAVTWPDGTPGVGVNNSHLLTTDNRGICTGCHHRISAD